MCYAVNMQIHMVMPSETSQNLVRVGLPPRLIHGCDEQTLFKISP